jgi:hypothetical protein
VSFCYIIPHNNSNNYQEVFNAGADPGFQVRGAHLKKLRRAKGGAKILGVFRVKNHDFTPKKSYFSNFRGGARNFWGISCEKSRFYSKKIIFFPISGARAPLDPPLMTIKVIGGLSFYLFLKTIFCSKIDLNKIK